MTTIQLKSEIKKVLDHVPDKVLADVLNLLKESQSQLSDKAVLDKFLEQTLTEDKGLLEKLAQ